MSNNADLICPKCQGQMRSYERNGITIDQCRECRGIFLDRGELERMIDAEGAYLQSAAAAPPPAAPGRSDRGHDERGGGHGREYGGKRRKGSFLSEFFD